MNGQVTHARAADSEAPPDVSEAVEHLFRHEWAKLVATLTRIFGIEHLKLAEDVVQEALVRALQTWPFYGVPEKPASWILRTARNLALDVVRREKNFRDKEPQIAQWMERDEDGEGSPDGEIADDTLRMILVCCHPRIPADAQAALALRTLCGFGAAEIARAFLTTEAATAKRLTRAKQKIREAKISFEIPSGAELARRLDGVLQCLYLLFNEGYKASGGERLVRAEVCGEAIRLAGLLAEYPAGNRPQTHALLALMLLNAARLPARVDGIGNLLRLQEQDRSLWDRGMMARGMFHLARSAEGGEAGVFHLQAGIAACHCAAVDYQSTDWAQILALYDRLMQLDGSPVVALNRAVVIANLQGPAAGLEAIGAMANLKALDDYHLLHAVRGELEMRLGHREAAAANFRRSLELAGTKSEEAFLAKRLLECGERV
ncbi:MAG: sigma-70 family RNA polymerase sigma factor [Verrucomicrobia bacterium]|nr:sigma-70 family RNA polymerase sigma factor [Verrucomicrobiota bacterium]MDE3098263.1 sigma-70 family RNA polymerase sigma factor [Verrucomicrobiota bacterium]